MPSSPACPRPRSPPAPPISCSRWTRSHRRCSACAHQSMTEADEPSFAALLQFLQQQRGFDFSGYKRPSLMRRVRSEEHTSELVTLPYLVCRLLLEKKKNKKVQQTHPRKDKLKRQQREKNKRK